MDALVTCTRPAFLFRSLAVLVSLMHSHRRRQLAHLTQFSAPASARRNIFIFVRERIRICILQYRLIAVWRAERRASSGELIASCEWLLLLLCR